jgi:hypothetical protein
VDGTEESVQEAIKSGDEVQAVNTATGHPATRYINPTTGQSVVVDDVTKEVIHVAGREAAICQEQLDGDFCQAA